MSEIIIKEVKNKKDMKKFVKFPLELYKDNENYIPALQSDEMNMYNREKNAAYEYCESIEILAYKDNKIVGRICGLINHAYNKNYSKNNHAN